MSSTWLKTITAVLLMGCAPARERETKTDTADSPTPSEPSTLAFAIGLWPGEGIPVIVTASPSLTLRESPRPRSAIVDTLVAAVGTRLIFDSTEYQTLDAGRLLVRATTRIAGRDFGDRTILSRDEYHSTVFPDTAFVLDVPASFELLQYRAEGACFVRITNRVLEVNPCPGIDTSHSRVESEPVTQWWIRVKGPRAYGWVVVSDTTARVARREF
jgi:hypothetical protein